MIEVSTGLGDCQPGIERVAIRHDVANTASAAVVAKAEFREVGRVESEPEAPGETGTEVIRERRADPDSKWFVILIVLSPVDC